MDFADALLAAAGVVTLGLAQFAFGVVTHRSIGASLRIAWSRLRKTRSQRAAKAPSRSTARL